jgi:hypothetical protein
VQFYGSALVLVVAITQILAFESRVRRLAGDSDLAQARDEFDRVAPAARDVRDVAAHLSDYALARGVARPRGVLTTAVPLPSAMSWRSSFGRAATRIPAKSRSSFWTSRCSRRFRAKRDWRQEDLVARLDELGFTGWRQSKIAKLEKGEVKRIPLDSVLGYGRPSVPRCELEELERDAHGPDEDNGEDHAYEDADDDCDYPLPVQPHSETEWTGRTPPIPQMGRRESTRPTCSLQSPTPSAALYPTTMRV